MKQRLLNILFWSVLSAAFIGPGTITTAASAGTEFGFALLWALVFSTIACIVLQEASARLTLLSGINLGEAIWKKFRSSGVGKFLAYLVLSAILLGCAAYETGNILGAVAGAALITDLSSVVLTLIIGMSAALLLWYGTTRFIAQTLGIIVAVMGLCFCTTAVIMGPSPGSLLAGSLLPSFPDGSGLLIIGLIGTTVVPYNLFLGSGLKHAQTLKEMRFGLIAAIALGGIVSMAVLVVGTAIAGSFSYEALAGQLGSRLGNWAATFFAAGLFSAGLSSTLTAALAAAITARSFLPSEQPERWSEKGRYYRGVWGGVLGVGMLFGVLQVQPVPAIILAQALNGIILPFVSIFLLLMVNHAGLLDSTAINSTASNILMGLIVFIAMMIGITNLFKAVNSVLQVSLVDEENILIASILGSLLVSIPVIQTLRNYRNR